MNGHHQQFLHGRVRLKPGLCTWPNAGVPVRAAVMLVLDKWIRFALPHSLVIAFPPAYHSVAQG